MLNKHYKSIVKKKHYNFNSFYRLKNGTFRFERPNDDMLEGRSVRKIVAEKKPKCGAQSGC